LDILLSRNDIGLQRYANMKIRVCDNNSVLLLKKVNSQKICYKKEENLHLKKIIVFKSNDLKGEIPFSKGK